MTNQLSAVIVDDEAHCIKTLEWELQRYCPEVDVIASFTNEQAALLYLQQQKPDILFLDIHLNQINGFELLEALENRPPVIFTTAYDEYAIQAFEVSAVDYLLKPLDGNKLKDAVSKVLDREDMKEDRWQSLIDKFTGQLDRHRKIAVPTFNGFDFFPVDDILYLAGQSNYCEIVLTNGDKILASRTIKAMSSQLENYHFLRIHKSYLINLGHIKRYLRGDGGNVVMDNGDSLPVSRQRKETLMKLFS